MKCEFNTILPPGYTTHKDNDNNEMKEQDSEEENEACRSVCGMSIGVLLLLLDRERQEI